MHTAHWKCILLFFIPFLLHFYLPDLFTFFPFGLWYVFRFCSANANIIVHPLERAAKSVKCIAFWLIRCYAIRSFRSISMNYWRRILCFYALIWKYCVYIFWSVSVVAALTHSLARTRIQSNTPRTGSAANATGTFIQITNKNGHQIYSFAFFWVVSLYFFCSAAIFGHIPEWIE